MHVAVILYLALLSRLEKMDEASGSVRLPRLIAFDLDYTLWDLWIDTGISGPLRRQGTELSKIYDKYGEQISLYEEVSEVLNNLISENVTIAACSRTDTPDLAREALELLLIPSRASGGEPTPAIEFFDQLEIYPGSKTTHFRQLHQKTGIPYSEMLFFDDETRNRDVEHLGVTFVLVEKGISQSVLEAGLKQWRKERIF